MAKSFSTQLAFSDRKHLQSYVLVGLGIIFLLGAWLLHPDYRTYPLGLFLFGAGILVASLLNPYRLLIAGILLTLIGISIFLAFKPLIPDGNGTLFFAVGLSLLAIAFAARRGYVSKGPITPALIILFVGLIEYGPTYHYFPSGFAPFILSLWFPGLGLLALGIIYLFARSK